MARGIEVANNSRTHVKLWMDTLSGFVDIAAEDPTRHCKDTQTVAHIDRVWVSEPEWLVCQIQRPVPVVSTPEFLSERGISDHAAARVDFRPRIGQGAHRKTAATPSKAYHPQNKSDHPT
eukprot:210540-Pyramimonas_sp.AAC.1